MEEITRATEHQNVPLEDSFSEGISKMNDILVLNVRGTKFEVLKSNFAYWPTTRLSRLVRAKTEEEILSLCEGFISEPSSPGRRCKEEYYFHRDWSNFNSILDLYRNNKKLHATVHICCMNYHGDLKYWGIDELLLDACCAVKHYPEMEKGRQEAQRERHFKQKEEQRKQYEEFGTSGIGRIRKFFLNLTEHPETSIGARVR